MVICKAESNLNVIVYTCMYFSLGLLRNLLRNQTVTTV